MDANKTPGIPPARGIKSYVLRGGRVTAAQLRSYRNLAPEYLVPFAPEKTDFKKIFGNDRPLVVEIGFGMGAATAQIAAENPDRNYLGIEVFRAGIGRLLLEIEKRGLKNIRLVEHDAAGVLDCMIAPASVSAFHIFFPDPWPKKRHHKRRLIKRPFTDSLAQKLLPGGYIYMVTDWEEYGEWALGELSQTPGLSNPYGGFAPPRQWRPKTKFEEKGLAKNHIVRELFFIHHKLGEHNGFE
ncbi:MAG: tRNA (guanosine(46)-N7)-methyltransferase TrmB [Treponema sp.]|jgi:tRNA (guanine-N7-)-methyltransferase|nr:tRNA (guanosine(46)-N7)-methyltransferase TrmB [Treponema sp.]